MADLYKIAGLIRKFRLHTITEEEISELWKWIGTERNRQLFKRLLNRKYEMNYLNELRQYETEAAWRRFTFRVRMRRRRIKKYVRIAAIFLLPLALSVFIYWWKGGRERLATPLEQAMTISPGERKAILTLADGRQLPLGKQEEKMMIAEEHAELFYDSTGLTYTSEQKGTTARMNEVYVPRKGEFSLSLSDGTKVYLNSDSRLTYPVAFNDSKREVALQGEAYFEVARDSLRPFLVKTAALTVRVLGTAFDVKSYAEDHCTETTLVEGNVEVEQGSRILMLKPGEQVRYHHATGEMDKIPVNTVLYTSWKDGLFVFDRQRLEDLFVILSRWYDVEVFFERQEIKDKLFTGDLKRYADIEVCLKMLELTNEVKFEIRGNTIVVK